MHKSQEVTNSEMMMNYKNNRSKSNENRSHRSGKELPDSWRSKASNKYFNHDKENMEINLQDQSKALKKHLSNSSRRSDIALMNENKLDVTLTQQVFEPRKILFSNIIQFSAHRDKWRSNTLQDNDPRRV